MHLLVDEALTAQQLSSPERYIYEICEMYGWEFPEDIVTTPESKSQISIIKLQQLNKWNIEND